MLGMKLCLAGVLAIGAICPLCGVTAGVGVASADVTPSRNALPTVAARVLTPARSDTTRVTLAIEGMTCGGCATTASIVLKRTEGVLDATVSYEAASAVVVYDEAVTSSGTIIERLEEMTGYVARIADEPDGATSARTGSSEK